MGMNTTMTHPAVLREPHHYAVATLDPATFAACDRTWTRGGTVLWCGRLVCYFDRTNRSVASALRGADEHANPARASAIWQARINARRATGGTDIAAEDAAASAVGG